MLFFPLINVKMPTLVGILTFMSRKNFMLNGVEHEKRFITSAWAWLTKPNDKVVIPKVQPCKSISGNTRIKVQSTACNVSHYAKK